MLRLDETVLAVCNRLIQQVVRNNRNSSTSVSLSGESLQDFSSKQTKREVTRKAEVATILLKTPGHHVREL